MSRFTCKLRFQLDLKGMTAPCLILLCSTLLMAWLLMPLVAMAKSALLVYTAASVATPHCPVASDAWLVALSVV